MADPNDPRLAALGNIQNQSRAYGRGVRRGQPDANVDPEFQAALEITDPEQRRAAMAQYARQRAQALFPQQQAPVQGADLVRQAFPQDNAFAPVGAAATPLPPAADVMSQMGGGDPDADADDQMFADLSQYGGPGDMEAWQSMMLPGAEDSPESVRARTNMGKELLAPRYAERADAGVTNEMMGPGSLATPADVRQFQATPLPGAEDSPESAIARQNAMKRILAPRGADRVDEMNEADDTRRIEGAAQGDGIDQIGRAAQSIMARRRVR